VKAQIRAAGVAALAVLGLLALPGVTNAGPCNANFVCQPGPHPVCYFVVRTYGKDTYFTVPAGSSKMMYGLQNDSRFCTSTGRPPNGNTCRQSPVVCK
jgi:hypothetical protein